MQAAACAFHADREALGVCVACRARVCAECTTKVEGINYCVRCLAERAQEAEGPSAPALSRGMRSLAWSALLWVTCLWLLTWFLLELAFPEAA